MSKIAVVTDAGSGMSCSRGGGGAPRVGGGRGGRRCSRASGGRARSGVGRESLLRGRGTLRPAGRALQQRRDIGEASAARGARRRAVAGGDRDEPDRRVPLHPAGVSDHEAPDASWWTDHQQRLDLGIRSTAALGAVAGGEARRHRIDQADVARRAAVQHRVRADRHRQRIDRAHRADANDGRAAGGRGDAYRADDRCRPRRAGGRLHGHTALGACRRTRAASSAHSRARGPAGGEGALALTAQRSGRVDRSTLVRPARTRLSARGAGGGGRRLRLPGITEVCRRRAGAACLTRTTRGPNSRRLVVDHVGRGSDQVEPCTDRVWRFVRSDTRGGDKFRRSDRHAHAQHRSDVRVGHGRPDHRVPLQRRHRDRPRVNFGS